MASQSCPVCYEEYNSEEEDSTPRRLVCSHVLCTKCIKNDFVESTFFCPECYCELKGEEINGFSSPVTVDELNRVDNQAENSGNDAQEEENIAFDIHLSHSQYFQRGFCSVPNCKNREIENGMCMRHGSRKNSMVEVDKIAIDLKNASFNIKTTQGNRIEAVDKKELKPNDLKDRFVQQKRIELGEAMDLIDRARDIMIREPNILYLEAPILAVGDIHGQFYDLLNLIEEGGVPGVDEQYVFLGDYVDRGSFSCEVMFLLLSYKVAFPDKIWLLRGNHECATVSSHFGFKQECKMKYGMNVYYRFLLLFQTMPLAAVVSTAYGDIFACHGGLSPSFKTLEDIELLHRFIEPEADSALLDILWSDPIPEENIDEMNDDEYEAFMNLEWRPNPSRGCSYTYGYKAIREFLDRNNLVCIVRAHEVQEDGYKKHFDPIVVEGRIKRLLHARTLALEKQSSTDPLKVELSIDIGDTDFPPLLTIFSAPNYCDRYQNKAAILKIDIGLDGFHAIQYECVKHPEPEIVESQTDNYILAIISACPYMPTSLRNFVRLAVELGPDLEQAPTSPVSPVSKPKLIASVDEPTKVASTDIASEKGKSKNIPMLRTEEQKKDKEIESFYKSKAPKIVASDTPDRASFTYVVNPLKSPTSKDRIPSMDMRKPLKSPTPSLKDVKEASTAEKAAPKEQMTTAVQHEAYLNAMVSDSINEIHPGRLPSVSMTPAHEIVIHEKPDRRGIFKIVSSAVSAIKKSIQKQPAPPTSPTNATTEKAGSGMSIFSSQKSPVTPLKSTPEERPSASKLVVEKMNEKLSLDNGKNGLVKVDSSNSLNSKRLSKRTSISDHLVSSQLESQKNITPEDLKAVKERAEKAAAYLTQYGVASVKLAKRAPSMRGVLNSSGTVSLTSSRSTDDFGNDNESTEGYFDARKKHLLPQRRTISADSGLTVSREASLFFESDDPNSSKFEEKEILGLKLMFSLFDRSGSNVITHEDLVAYGEDTGDLSAIRDAAIALEIVDIDGDGKIGLVDFIRFATRLKIRWTKEQLTALIGAYFLIGVDGGKGQFHIMELDKTFVRKLVQALLDHHATDSSNKSSNQLLGESSSPVLVQIQLSKDIVETVVHPVSIQLPHSLFSSTEDDHSICLFCKSDEKEAIEKYLEDNPIEGLTKVVSLNEVKKLFAVFNDRKQLLANHSHFVCDERIFSHLRNLLGKVFGKHNHFPTPIKMPKVSKLSAAIGRFTSSVQMTLRGRNITLKLGSTSMSVQNIVSNIIDGLSQAIDKLPGQGNTIQSMHIKLLNSPALPLFVKGTSEALEYVKSKAASTTATAKTSTNSSKSNQSNATPSSPKQKSAKKSTRKETETAAEVESVVSKLPKLAAKATTEAEAVPPTKSIDSKKVKKSTVDSADSTSSHLRSKLPQVKGKLATTKTATATASSSTSTDDIPADIPAELPATATTTTKKAKRPLEEIKASVVKPSANSTSEAVKGPPKKSSKRWL